MSRIIDRKTERKGPKVAHNDEHIPADAGERVRRGWSGDAIVHDQDHHQRHLERTGWSGDEVVHDQSEPHSFRSR